MTTSRRRRIVELLPIALVAVAAGAWAIGNMGAPVTWTPDGLFYEAHVLELRGQGHDQALDAAWSGAPAAQVRARPRTPTATPRISNSRPWYRYSAHFYERRWTVPVLAAVIWPLAGTSSLQIVSLLGYLLIVPALYGLLRLRFPPLPSAGATALCVALEPLLRDARTPITDALSLALETACVLVLLLIARGRAWLAAPWLALVVVTAFTRDAAWTTVLATVALALATRARLLVVLAASSAVVATLPLLFGGAPLKDQWVYSAHDSEWIGTTSWTHAVAVLPGDLLKVFRNEAGYAAHHPIVAIVFGIGGICALRLLRRPDDFVVALAGAGFAAFALTYLPASPSNFRIELALVPVAAAGLADGLTFAGAAIEARRGGLPVTGGRARTRGRPAGRAARRTPG